MKFKRQMSEKFFTPLVYVFLNPLLHEWPRQYFSLQYQYNINQTSDENKEKYQFGDN